MDPSITDEEDFVNWAAGNTVLDESTPMAHRYVLAVNKNRDHVKSNI